MKAQAVARAPLRLHHRQPQRPDGRDQVRGEQAGEEQGSGGRGPRLSRPQDHRPAHI